MDIVQDHETHAKPKARLETLIVDADAHVNPSYDMWEDYLPEALKPMAPKIESAEDCDYVVFEGRRRKLNLISAQAGREGKDFKMHGRAADARAGGWAPNARVADMDEDGIDTAILFGGGPLGTSNVELFKASFYSYNAWLADFCNYAPKRFAGVGYIAMENVDDAITMMRDAVKRGLKAVNIPAFPMSKMAALNSGADAQMMALTGDVNADRSYADAEFDPFWKAACDLGIPITIHLGGRAVRFTEPKFLLSDMLMSKFGMAEPISVMIYGGVFQRFPDLKLASVESGVGWFGFAVNYMDETWNKQRYWVNSVLEKPPSYFWEKNIYGSFIHDRAGILTRSMPGAGNIMWSSDYPHSETTFPESHKVIERLFEGVPEAERDLIVGGRAKTLYNL